MPNEGGIISMWLIALLFL